MVYPPACGLFELFYYGNLFCCSASDDPYSEENINLLCGTWGRTPGMWVCDPVASSVCDESVHRMFVRENVLRSSSLRFTAWLTRVNMFQWCSDSSASAALLVAKFVGKVGKVCQWKELINYKKCLKAMQSVSLNNYMTVFQSQSPDNECIWVLVTLDATSRWQQVALGNFSYIAMKLSANIIIIVLLRHQI